MSKKIHERYSNLKIEDFGPIKEGKLSFAPLTVLIGPNNSGKSFISLLYHSLTSLNLDKYNSFDDLEESFTGSDRLFLKNLKYKIHHELKHDLIEYIKSKPNMNSEPFIFPRNLVNELYQKICRRFFLKPLKNNIEIFFGRKFDNLIQKGKKRSSIIFNEIPFEFEDNDINLIDFDVDMYVDENIKFNDKEDVCKFKSIDGELHFNFRYSYFEEELISEINNFQPSEFTNNEIDEKDVVKLFEFAHNNPFHVTYPILSEQMFDLVFLTIINKFWGNNSYYIPVGKTEVVYNLKDIISHNLIDDDHGYSKPQKHLTNDFVTIDYNEKGYFYELASEMERNLFNGRIEVDTKYDVPEIYFMRSDDLKLSSTSMSSSISELVPIILYLKHVLKKGDTLILEEPESHLHPQNQRFLIKNLVKCINSGLKVLITTHSDYVLEQINNQLKINKIKNKDLKKSFMHDNKYTDENLLNENQLNVYNFKEIEFNIFEAEKLKMGDFGIEENSFQYVVKELYGETEKIDDYITRS